MGKVFSAENLEKAGSAAAAATQAWLGEEDEPVQVSYVEDSPDYMLPAIIAGVTLVAIVLLVNK